MFPRAALATMLLLSSSPASEEEADRNPSVVRVRCPEQIITPTP